MKRILTFLVVLQTLIASCQIAVKKEDFNKMSWLEGTWKGELNGQVFYENWTRVGEFEFVNINFEVCNGDTVVNNRSKIEIRNKVVAYTSGELTWNLKELTLNSCVFENSRFRERFVFTNPEEDTWIAELFYPTSKVKYQLKKIIDFNFLLKQRFVGIIGEYKGYMKFNEQQIPFTIDFDTSAGQQNAYSSIPENLQLRRPFSNICFNPPYLRLTTPDGERALTIQLEVSGDTITGKLQEEFPISIFLKKDIRDTSPKSNYETINSTLVKGLTTLPYSIYMPKNVKSAPGVIMISGTGQHTKDEYNGWADMLSRKGIATLIYNKRNVTNFPELNIRHRSTDIGYIDSLVSDVQDMYQILKTVPGINPDKIGLIGFSQGAVVAPIVAASTKGIAFIVAISGNSTTDKEFIINQAINRLRQRNLGDARIKQAKEIWEQLFNYAKDRKDGKQIQKSLDKAYEEGFGQYCLPRNIPNDDELKYLMTWNSFELDPALHWQKVNIPSLVIFGSNDILIPVDRSVSILSTIFSRRPNLLTLKVFPEADHTIKIQHLNGQMIFPRFADGYLELIQSWLSRVVQ